jgi:hypothetical protein
MASWTYRCYNDGKSPNLWQRWYDEHPSAQGSHDAAFGILEQLKVWREPNAKAFDEVVEVRFKAGGIQHRIFGFYGPGVRQQFIFTGVGYHKGKNYTPKGILSACALRRSEIEDDPKKAIGCTRPDAPSASE